MLTFSEKYFNRIYWFVCSFVFVIVVLRCINVPFAHDEVATFFFYIQHGKFIPFLSHPDANGHFLISALGWVSFELFGSSTFSLRLPSMLGFVILCYGIFKVNKLFTSPLAKIFLSACFILSFNFISFFSACRGYGLSMSLLILALYYFYRYIKELEFNHFLKFILFSQLALSANLTLVLVITLLTGILMLFQINSKQFFEKRNVTLLIVHFSLLFFWVKFGFYLKEKGALYAGAGDSYWKVTFETLIETILFKNVIINGVAIGLFIIMLLYFGIKLYSAKLAYLIKNNFMISFVLLCSLIIGFFLLKKLFHVNYPEDRIGLFFYVFFILSLCFMLNDVKKVIQPFFLAIPVALFTHFLLHVNTRIHPWEIYETVPIEFFEKLKAEQAKKNYPITIAGHRLVEFFYGFYNYNSPVKLSHITSPEALQMNCDYAICYKKRKPYYQDFYDEIASEADWGFVLLKRRLPLERKLVDSTKTVLTFSGNNEYYNLFEKSDTVFNSINPLLAEVKLSVEKVPVPFHAWLAFSVDCLDDNDKSFNIRVPFNLIKYDWNGTKDFTTCIVSGNVPVKIKRIVVYLWNINKGEVEIKINSFKLYQLNGEGVTVVAPVKR